MVKANSCTMYDMIWFDPLLSLLIETVRLGVTQKYLMAGLCRYLYLQSSMFYLRILTREWSRTQAGSASASVQAKITK